MVIGYGLGAPFVSQYGGSQLSKDGLLYKSGGLEQSSSGLYLNDSAGSRDGALGGSSYYLDGVDDYIEYGTDVNDLGTGDFSFSCRVKLVDLLTDYYILGKFVDSSDRYYFRINDISGQIQFWSVGGGTTSCRFLTTSGVAAAEWLTIVVVCDRSVGWRVYVNNVQMALSTDVVDSTDLDNSANFQIGEYSSVHYKGNVCDVRFWNKALAYSEASRIHEGAEILGDEDFMDFCQVRSEDASIDSSGNNNHGVFNNANLSTILSSDSPIDYMDLKGYGMGWQVYSDPDTSASIPDGDTIRVSDETSWTIVVDMIKDSTYDDIYGRFFRYENVNTWIRLNNGLGNLHGSVAFSSSHSTFTASNAWNLGDKMRVALVFNEDSDNKIKMYLNGVAVSGSQSAGSGTVTTTANLNIAAYSSSNSAAGLYKDFVIYNRALSAAEMSSESFENVLTSALKERFVFDVGSGTSITGTNGAVCTLSAANWSKIPVRSTETKDVFGDSLFVSGKARYNSQLINNSCATGDGTSTIGTLGQPADMDWDAGTDEFTISFKTKSTDTAGAWMCKGDVDNADRVIYIYSQTTMKYTIGGTTYDSASSAMLDGNEHEMTFVNYNDSGTLKMDVYLDGVAIHTDNASGTGAGTNAIDWTLFARRASGNTGNDYEGNHTMWDVKFFSGDKRSNVADIITGAYTTDLLHHIPGNEKFGNTLYDVVGDAHCEISGATVLWGTTQDWNNYSLTKGYSLYTHASTDDIHVPYGVDGNPISITPPSGYSLVFHYPAQAGALTPGMETLELNPNSFSVIDNTLATTTFTYADLEFDDADDHVFFTDETKGDY